MDTRLALLIVGVISLGGLLMVSTLLEWKPYVVKTPPRDGGFSVGVRVIPTSLTTSLPPQVATEEAREHAIAVTTPEVATALPHEGEVSELKQYIEITDGCGPYWSGECLNVRSGPGVEFPSVFKLRNGVVLASSGAVEAEGELWYKVIFDEWVRYPERVKGEWYVAGAYVHTFWDVGPEEASGQEPAPEKRIIVDRSEQKLYAYEGDVLFMEETISTGLDFTPTPRGTFSVFKKTPTRYMQGPLPGVSSDYYDLPGVPWNLYFTKEGGAIHGTYWHDNFGKQWSHGCVNLPTDKAQELYIWSPIGTTVTVQD